MPFWVGTISLAASRGNSERLKEPCIRWGPDPPGKKRDNFGGQSNVATCLKWHAEVPDCKGISWSNGPDTNAPHSSQTSKPSPSGSGARRASRASSARAVCGGVACDVSAGVMIGPAADTVVQPPSLTAGTADAPDTFN